MEVVSEGEVKGEEKPEGEKVDPWKMVGNATLTPCGPGVRVCICCCGDGLSASR